MSKVSFIFDKSIHKVSLCITFTILTAIDTVLEMSINIIRSLYKQYHNSLSLEKSSSTKFKVWKSRSFEDKLKPIAAKATTNTHPQLFT